MSELPITIPTLLREKLGKGFDTGDIWGYIFLVTGRKTRLLGTITYETS